MIFTIEQVCADLTTMTATSAAASSAENESRLRRLVALLLPHAATAVMEKCDLTLLTSRKRLRGPIYPDNERPGIGRLRLPDDFMRLISFRLRGWTSDVVRLITPADGPAYALRLSPWPEISGSTEVPRCYLTAGPAGNYMEIHGLTTPAAAVTGEYAPRPYMLDGGIELPKSLYGDILNRLASDIKTHLS